MTQSSQQTVKTLAILFADISGSTWLYEQFGDVEAHRRIAESLGFMEQAITRHAGKLLRTVGDSALASFAECDDALQAACELQHLHENTLLSVRVGFHYGQVIQDKGDLYGNAVNIAARIAEFARADEIATTEQCVVRLNQQNRLRATLLDAVSVKGVSELLQVYRIQWQDPDGSATAVARPFQHNLHQIQIATLELHMGSEHLHVDHAGQTISIGRAEENDLTIEGDRASRRHAHVAWAQGQFLLTDESTNGTFIKKNSTNPLFVRRETVVLDGQGMIGAGVVPQQGADKVIYFNVKMDKSHQ